MNDDATDIPDIDELIREEQGRWLLSRGEEGGTLAEFQAHLAARMETDPEFTARVMIAEWKAHNAGKLPRRSRKTPATLTGGFTGTSPPCATSSATRASRRSGRRPRRNGSRRSG